MPREKTMEPQRAVFHLTPELKERISDFRFANRLKSEAETFRLLLELGLKQAPKEGWKAK